MNEELIHYLLLFILFFIAIPYHMNTIGGLL